MQPQTVFSKSQFENHRKASIQEIEKIFKNNESTLYVLFMASYPKVFRENYPGTVQTSVLMRFCIGTGQSIS